MKYSSQAKRPQLDIFSGTLIARVIGNFESPKSGNQLYRKTAICMLHITNKEVKKLEMGSKNE